MLLQFPGFRLPFKEAGIQTVKEFTVPDPAQIKACRTKNWPAARKIPQRRTQKTPAAAADRGPQEVHHGAGLDHHVKLRVVKTVFAKIIVITEKDRLARDLLINGHNLSFLLFV